MNVLHLNDHLDYRGGIETYLLNLIPRLDAAGVRCAVGFSAGDATLTSQAICLPALGSAGLRSDRQGRADIRRVLKLTRPDVVHLHNVQNIDIVEECLDCIPVVFTAHDYRYLCPASTFFYRRTESICDRSCGPACFSVTLRKKCLSWRPRHAWAYYRRVRRVSQNRDRFRAAIAPSQAAGERLRQAGFVDRQIEVLPYFCPIEPRHSPRPLPGSPHLLFIGRMSANKGWKYFLQLLGSLPASVSGTIVGNLTADSRREAEQVARVLNCANRLQLRGWAGRDEVRGILESATVLIFPSLWSETLGIVGLEALACGVPVVASDVGGVREWAIPERTGLLARPKDVGAMAAAVLRLVESSELNTKMGRAGLQLIRDKFSPDRHVAELLRVYNSATQSSGLEQIRSRQALSATVMPSGAP